MNNKFMVSMLGRLKVWAAFKRERAYIAGDPLEEMRWLLVLEALTTCYSLAQDERKPDPKRDSRDSMGVLPLGTKP